VLFGVEQLERNRVHRRNARRFEQSFHFGMAERARGVRNCVEPRNQTICDAFPLHASHVREAAG